MMNMHAWCHMKFMLALDHSWATAKFLGIFGARAANLSWRVRKRNEPKHDRIKCRSNVNRYETGCVLIAKFNAAADDPRPLIALAYFALALLVLAITMRQHYHDKLTRVGVMDLGHVGKQRALKR